MGDDQMHLPHMSSEMYELVVYSFGLRIVGGR